MKNGSQIACFEFKERSVEFYLKRRNGCHSDQALKDKGTSVHLSARSHLRRTAKNVLLLSSIADVLL
jgi:hypothetical protein